MKLENQHILILSNEPWGETWFSKHNYAWELAKKNKVYFINPPVPFRPLNIFSSAIHQEKITDNLYVLTYKNILPVSVEILRKINEGFVFKRLKNLLDLHNAKQPIFWTFDPSRLTSPELLNCRYTIFHAVDKYRFLRKAEYVITKKADLIICVAEEIAEIYRDKNKNVRVLPHAIASDEIIKQKKQRGSKLIGVFVGNIDKRIDFAYTAEMIQRFPEVEFHFVGKIINDGSPSHLVFEKGFKNVIHHGEKPFKELKKFISQADFCILFKVNEVGGNKISSHKMLQYFAQGKPIFASHLTQYEPVKHLLYMSDNREITMNSFANFVKHREDDKLFDERINYAQQHSFENIILKIEGLIA
ncbi:MAG: hypothetical protein J0L69_03210 [Bacteroidetes bacterium]|nr:hypothetical protein [Bacteroidota bacterium]